MLSIYFFIAATLLLSLNFVRPFGLAISDWLYFIALGLALVETTFFERKHQACWTKNRFILPTGLILFGAIISTSRALNIPVALSEIIQQVYVTTIFISLTWIMVRRGYTNLIIGAFILSGLFSALVAILDNFTGSNFGPILSGTPNIQFWYRHAGTLGHPNKFGYFLVLTSIITFSYLGSLKRKPLINGLIGVALVTQLFAIYLSGSVTAYLGIALGLLILLVPSSILQLKVLPIALSLIVIGVLFMITITVFDIKSPFHRIQTDTGNIITLSVGRVESFTANSRIFIYKQAFAQIEKSPFIGVGFDQVSTSDIEGNSRFLDYSVHNVFLQIFYTGGLFAFIGWLIIYVYISWESIKIIATRNTPSLALCLAASVLSIILMDQFQDAIYQREKWLAIGLLMTSRWSGFPSKTI